ncbi:MAG: AzlC family ABC transporter permease [Chloroflexota bacterium]
MTTDIKSINQVATARETFFLGFRTVLPILVGVVPFGMIMGVVSAEGNLTTFQTFFRAAFVFAGVSELVMLDLLAQGTTIWIIVLSAFVINLRQLIYSASIGEHYNDQPLGWKLLLSYTLVDQVFALSSQYFDEYPSSPFKRQYHLGTAVPIAVAWFSAIVTGYFLGAVIPDNLSLDFVVPLMFLSLVPPAIKGYSYIAAALVSAVAALLAFGLPNNLGLMVATFSGILVGYLLEGDA